MKTWTLRLGLSLMVAMGFWANRLPAQTITVAPGGEQVFVVPVVPYEPALIYPYPSPLAEKMPPELARHRLQYLMNQHGVSCKSNSPWGACGNLHYDFNFIFGSCRWFFSERCDANQHHGSRYWSR